MAGFRQSSQAHGAGLSPYARNTIREAISRDTPSSQQRSPPARSEDLPPEVWLPSLSTDDERFLHAARSRVLLDEPACLLRGESPRGDVNCALTACKAQKRPALNCIDTL